jgi:hypothetical protein
VTDKRNAFRLGLASLLMIAMFFAVMIFISGRQFAQPVQRFTVRFPSNMYLPSLKVGGPVICGGRGIGAIDSVRFKEIPHPDQPDASPTLYVYVSAKVVEPVGLRRDCRIVATGPLLGGAGQLVIRDRGLSADLLTEDAVVDGVPAGSFDDVTAALARELDGTAPNSLLSQIKSQLNAEDAASLVAKVHRSMDDLNHISSQINRQLNPAERDVIISKVHGILDHINVATRAVSDEMTRTNEGALMNKVHDSVDTIEVGLKLAVAILEENRAPLGDTLKNVESLTEQLDRKVVAAIVTELAPNDPTNLLGKLHKSLDGLVTSLDDANVITRDGRQIVELNKPKINSTLEDIRAAADILRGGLKYVARHPWALYNKPTAWEQRDLNVVQAARDFSEAAGRLDNSIATLDAFVTANTGNVAVDDGEYRELRARLTDAIKKFGEAETKLWEELGTQ